MARNTYKSLSRPNWKEELRKWVELHYLQLALFNVVLVILLLLRSAGYFEPFFGITINSIFFIALVLSIFLLGTRSRGAFTVALIFWLFTALLRLAGINVWAERTSIYVFQAMLVGVILFIIESVFRNSQRREKRVREN